MNPKIFRLLHIYNLRKKEFVILPSEIAIIDSRIDNLLEQSKYLSEKLLTLSPDAYASDLPELEDLYDKLEMEQFSVLLTGLEILS